MMSLAINLIPVAIPGSNVSRQGFRQDVGIISPKANANESPDNNPDKVSEFGWCTSSRQFSRQSVVKQESKQNSCILSTVGPIFGPFRPDVVEKEFSVRLSRHLPRSFGVINMAREMT